MAHLKRHRVPKNWPVARKGSAYLVKPNSDLSKGMPILVVLRDVLGIAQNKKEVKKAVYLKNVLLNNKPVKSEKESVVLFDTIVLAPSKKAYRIGLSESGKFAVDEIKENEASNKIAKIVNKKMLKGKKTQLNLSDGRNFLSDIKCKVNDSLLINFKGNKIEKCLEMKEGAEVVVFEGKHTGSKGVIRKIKPERKMVSLTTNEKELNVLIKQIMVVK